MEKSTIAAISTAQLPAGIAVIRISGDKAIEITDKIFFSKKPLCEASSHTVSFGIIKDGNEKLDEVLVTVMRAPATYTGEDVVEISCHGSILIQKKILTLLTKNGANLAGPGEFTMRAFLNGKMDIAKAEAVMDVISSDNDAALKASMSALSGNFSALITELREKILYEIAYIEAALDDPEHMSLEGFSDKLYKVVTDAITEINKLSENTTLARRITEGISCAIVGGVNVGKSSLLNALTGEDTAIVTDIPGTTRDSISTRVNMGEFTLNIIDTAGIRESDDAVEQIGIARSKEYMDNAEMVLYVIDVSESLSTEDINGIKSLENKNAIILLNKNDLSEKISVEEIKNYTSKPVLSISVKRLEGLSEIKEEIKKIFFGGNVKLNSEILVANERHINLLNDAENSLKLVLEAIDNQMTEEIFAVDLTDAYESLGKILGKELSEDVIEEIFSKFCIGK